VADVTPKLERHARTTIPALNVVRRVVAPAGARMMHIGIDEAIWWETPAADKADGAAEDATAQLYLPAGKHDIPLTGTGESDVPVPQLARPTYFYFVATVAGQDFSVRFTAIT
jgi:hypothetical protein